MQEWGSARGVKALGVVVGEGESGNGDWGSARGGRGGSGVGFGERIGVGAPRVMVG